MWTRSYSKVYQQVNKKDVWRVWADVNNWPKWDKGLAYCKLGSAFVKGSQFILKPVGGPEVRIVLSEVVAHETFTDYCKFFGATMYDVHELAETADGLRVINTITVTGPLRFLWIKLVAKNIVASLPEQMDKLIEFVKESHE